MTPSRRAAETARKRAERLRRKEAGEVRVEVWLSAELMKMLDEYAHKTGFPRQDAIKSLILREDFMKTEQSQ